MTDVPQGTIAEVLDWVGEDPDRADLALQAEYLGQNRSTLITQLEAIAVKEATPVTETTTDPGYDEETGLAPGPEPPEVALNAEDPDTTVLPPVVANSEVELPDDAGQLPEDGLQVEWMTGAVAPHGFVLVINGQAFTFSPEQVASLRAIVNSAVAGVSL
jgi:hypothetical protein